MCFRKSKGSLWGILSVRIFQDCLKKVSRLLEDILMVLQFCFKVISGKLQGCKSSSRKFFLGVSKNF